ncbi:MAG: hypothetical protein R6V85_03985 [Polyangia bacterium]
MVENGTDEIGREDLLDALLDLDHDLGKHIRLPVSMLPASASPVELREALATALLRTRRGPRGTSGAREIWREFEREAGGALAGLRGAENLTAALAAALSWEDVLEGGARIDRDALERDLTEVREKIRDLIEEVSGD